MPAIPVSFVTDQKDTSLTTFTIKVDGEELSAAFNILSIDVFQAINHISFSRILLYDGDAAKQDFEISGGEQFELGKEIELFAGYQMQETALFKGILTKQKIKIKSSGGSLLFLEIRDLAFKMTLDRKSKYFKEVADTDLFSQIAQEHGIDIDTNLLGQHHLEITQYHVSDWDFIVSRAERLGGYCLFHEGLLKIKKMTPDPLGVINLTYGVDIFDADLEMEARTQYESVMTSSWDYTKQELLTAEVSDVSAPSQGFPNGSELAEVGSVGNFNLRHSGHLSQQELDAWAEAQMIKSRFARIRGTVKIQGNAACAPGNSAELKGFGNRFNGLAFISGIRHTVGDGNWTTTLQIGDSPEWHIEKYPVNTTPGALFNPATNGLLIGVVTQLQDDPNGEDRILIKIPSIDDKDQGTWCRIARPDAGENRGIIWFPEIGDEVVLGFINDDPNQPVVLGMLHSSAKPSPLPGSDDNHLKGIVSRSDMRLTFDDEGKILTLQTPEGNKITLNDDEGSVVMEDKNGSLIRMNADGITLESSKDIVLKATGDIKVDGMNIAHKAQLNFKGEGSAGASLTSSGTTEVKGSLVNIN